MIKKVGTHLNKFSLLWMTAANHGHQSASGNVQARTNQKSPRRSANLPSCIPWLVNGGTRFATGKHTHKSLSEQVRQKAEHPWPPCWPLVAMIEKVGTHLNKFSLLWMTAANHGHQSASAEQCFFRLSSCLALIHYIKASRRLRGGFAECRVAYAENSFPTGASAEASRTY